LVSRRGSIRDECRHFGGLLKFIREIMLGWQAFQGVLHPHAKHRGSILSPAREILFIILAVVS